MVAWEGNRSSKSRIMKKLHITRDFEPATSLVTETCGILAVRGAGKTNAARVVAESMFEAKLPFVAVDPVGSWRGLRSSRSGKGPGLPIPIFGGKWGDVPLERGGGTLIADLIVDTRLSCVLDLSNFESESAKKVFLLDFARRLYLKNEEPLHLFLDEADDFIPQKPIRDEVQLLRAWENIVRRGRARGLGITLITQRSAAVNKMVLTQVGTLIAMRTTGPQDRAAIEAWLKYNSQSHEILASLPGLDDGEAWIWSPHFMKKTVRTRFPLSKTFDAGATPKVGRGKVAATLADVDLGAIRKRMEETIERAKAEDPKELKRRVAELERELQILRTQKAEVVERERLVVDEEGLEELQGRLDEALGAVHRTATDAQRLVGQHVRGYLKRCTGRSKKAVRRPSSNSSPVTLKSSPKQGSGRAPTGGIRRILKALAQAPDGLNKQQLGIRAQLSSKSGTFGTYLSVARTNGWLEGSNQLLITAEGIASLGDSWEPLPTGADLVSYWYKFLGVNNGATRMLAALIDKYPHTLTREELGERAEVSHTSGTFGTYMSKLRKLELIRVIDGDPDKLKATEELGSWGE